MKKCIALCLIISLMGCTTLSTVRSENRENLSKLRVGMSKDEVLKIMGTDTKTCHDPLVTIFTFGLGGIVQLLDPNKITNPYRTETLQSQDETRGFEVLYYYTDVKERSGSITDDELTPLVLENNKLIGWGWMFLDDKVRKYELRIR